MKRSSSYLNSFIPPLAAATLLLCLAPSLHAQERLPAEEILRFFPMDSYEEVSHEETALIMASKHVDHFNRSGKLSLLRRLFPFTQDALNEAESLTHARMTRVFVYSQDEENVGRHKERSSRQVAMDFGDISYAGEGVGEDLLVMRYLDPGALIKKMVESGELAEAGAGPKGLALYSAKKEDIKGFERVYFLVSLPTGEIICAEKKATLARMLKAGTGEEASILGDPDYLSCEEIFGESGQAFTWGNFEYMSKAVIAYAEKKNAPAEHLANHKKIMEMPQHQTADGAIWDFSGKDVVYKSISIYRSEEGAIAAKKWRESGNIRMNQYAKTVESLTKFSIDNNQLIATRTYDEATNKKLKEAWEELKKLNEEKKKAQEEKEEGK